MHLLHVWVVGNWRGGGRPELENGLWPPADGEALIPAHGRTGVLGNGAVNAGRVQTGGQEQLNREGGGGEGRGCYHEL